MINRVFILFELLFNFFFQFPHFFLRQFFDPRGFEFPLCVGKPENLKILSRTEVKFVFSTQQHIFITNPLSKKQGHFVSLMNAAKKKIEAENCNWLSWLRLTEAQKPTHWQYSRHEKSLRSLFPIMSNCSTFGFVTLKINPSGFQQ